MHSLLANFESFSTAWLISEWLIRLVALLIVPRNRKPTSGMAWLLLIFLFPLLGLLIYLIIGNPKLPKSRRDAQKTLDTFIERTLQVMQKSRDAERLLDAKAPAEYASTAALCTTLSHLPVFGGNAVELLPEYDDALAAITADIATAKQFIHIEYFIIVQDHATMPLFDELARAVARGVIVRVMYDTFLTKRFPGYSRTIKRLKRDGVLVQAMLPFRLPGFGYVRPDLRNHRKLIVIDGTTGYTGSQNLVQRDYHRKDNIYYDELVVRTQGPVTLQLAAVFLTDWYSETGELLDYTAVTSHSAPIQKYGDSLAQILPSGPGYDDENNLKLFTSLIHSARKKIVITNPYFVPDESLLNAITTAVRSGVAVTMINSEVMDQWLVGHAQRSFYEALLRAGVKIYWYKAPILLHSKFMTIDDGVATIGSSNLDIRSFELDLEVTLVSYDPAVVASLRQLEQTYISRSAEITHKVWAKRPKYQRLFDNLARLTAALQ